MKTPMQLLKERIENMIENGGDADLLCIKGLINTTFINEEKQHIKLAFKEGGSAGITVSKNPEHYYLRTYTD